MKALALLVLVLALTAAVAVSKVSIEGVRRSTPLTANSYLIYDDKQVLVVDTGKEEDGVVPLQQRLDQLLADGRNLNGFFITHGHPDHCMALWKLQQQYPKAPTFVGSVDTRNEMVALMSIFGPYLNMSSPGNPRANATGLFNYESLTVLRSHNGIIDHRAMWDGDELIVFILDDGAETSHSSFIYVPSTEALVTGDLMYVRTHLFLGYDVNLIAQCNWMQRLASLKKAFKDTTRVYPGHGPAALDVSFHQLVQENIDYIQKARSVFINSCTPDDATKALLAAFPSWDEPLMLSALTAPFRVPLDGNLLGCNCKTSSCQPPACTI